MKIKQISVTVSETINVGNYCSVSPGVTLTADLESGEESGEAQVAAHTALFQQASKMFARQAIQQLARVASRRGGDDRKTFLEMTSGTRQQLKVMISG